jgi:hypothetical protein
MLKKGPGRRVVSPVCSRAGRGASGVRRVFKPRCWPSPMGGKATGGQSRWWQAKGCFNPGWKKPRCVQAQRGQSPGFWRPGGGGQGTREEACGKARRWAISGGQIVGCERRGEFQVGGQGPGGTLRGEGLVGKAPKRGKSKGAKAWLEKSRWANAGLEAPGGL